MYEEQPHGFIIKSWKNSYIVIGYTSLESKLNVKGAATFDSTVYVEGASNIKGAVSLKDILDVEKAVTMDSTLYRENNIELDMLH